MTITQAYQQLKIIRSKLPLSVQDGVLIFQEFKTLLSFMRSVSKEYYSRAAPCNYEFPFVDEKTTSFNKQTISYLKSFNKQLAIDIKCLIDLIRTIEGYKTM